MVANIFADIANLNEFVNQSKQEECVDKMSTNFNAEIRLAVYNFEKRLGVYHVGILVHGKEFHFGIKRGIIVCNPRNDGKTFFVVALNFLPRKMHFLRYMDIPIDGTNLHTSLTLDQLLLLKTNLECGRFGPNNYRFYWNNCVDFCFHFLRLIAVNGHRLTKQALPGILRQPWVTEPVRAVSRKMSRKKKHD